jgi:hypothetical protein
MQLKVLDLFSGLGGFSLGLERTGCFTTVAFCEIDKYCKLILNKHWKGIKIYDDVKKITTSKTAWSSRLCVLTWKVKDTKFKRSIFQLQVSVPRTGEKESGSLQLWATPNSMDHLPQRSPESLLRQATTTRKGRTRPANLREQVNPETVKMWRTPDAHCNRGPSSKERMKMKLEKGMPISLNDQVAHPNMMWPTPRANKVIPMITDKNREN